MSRNTLHRTKLGEFQTWLIGDGWALEPTKGAYEVLRARKEKRLLLIYDRHEGDHLSYADKFGGIVQAFIKARKAGTDGRQK